MNTIDIVGAVFIIVAGCLFHFLYEWTHHSKLVGFFTAVNESTWEHLKLFIAPSFLWFVAELHLYNNEPILAFAHFIGMLAGLITIPVIFYAYSAIFKRDILFFDILAFILAAIIEQVIFSFLLHHLDLAPIIAETCQHIGIFGLITIFFFYITRTFVPDHNFLTKDPITKKYGIRGHYDPKPSKKSKKRKKSKK